MVAYRMQSKKEGPFPWETPSLRTPGMVRVNYIYLNPNRSVVGYSSVLTIYVISVSKHVLLLCERLVLVVNNTSVLKSNILSPEKRCAPQVFGVNSGICVGTSYTCVFTPYYLLFSSASDEKCPTFLLYSIFSKKYIVRDFLDLSKLENLVHFCQMLFERHDVPVHFQEHLNICI